MSEIQEIELQRHHEELVSDVRELVEKYRRIMDWDVPDNDDAESDRLIMQAIKSALVQVEEELLGKGKTG